MPFILLDGNINRLVLTDEQAGEGIVGLLLMQCTDQILSYFQIELGQARNRPERQDQFFCSRVIMFYPKFIVYLLCNLTTIGIIKKQLKHIKHTSHNLLKLRTEVHTKHRWFNEMHQISVFFSFACAVDCHGEVYFISGCYLPSRMVFYILKIVCKP